MSTAPVTPVVSNPPLVSSWIWVIDTGTLLFPSTRLPLTRGFSGNQRWINDPASINVHMHGPLPCGPDLSPGQYTLGRLLPNTDPAPTNPYHRLGPNICQIIPTIAQARYMTDIGRDPDSFFLHGGIAGEPVFIDWPVATRQDPAVPKPTLPTSSDGCIVLAPTPRMVVLTSTTRSLLCVPSWPMSSGVSPVVT